MKKILLLFVLLFGLNVSGFSKTEALEIVEYNSDAPTWVVYRDDDGHWYWYDDGCDKDTMIIGDEIVFEESGSC